MLPLAVCSPKVGERKWFKHSPEAERDCPEFEPKEIAEDGKEETAEEPDAVPEQEADASPSEELEQEPDPEVKPEQDAPAEVVKEDAADSGVKGKAKEAPKRTNTGKRKSK